MAHYVFLDDENIVIDIITGVDEEIVQVDFDGTEVGGSSEAWESWYGNLRGQVCKRASYNGNYRKNYPGLGWFYDSVKDAFIAPQPYPSWILDENTCLWFAPVPEPNPKGQWAWDENSLSWFEVS